MDHHTTKKEGNRTGKGKGTEPIGISGPKEKTNIDKISKYTSCLEKKYKDGRGIMKDDARLPVLRRENHFISTTESVFVAKGAVLV